MPQFTSNQKVLGLLNNGPHFRFPVCKVREQHACLPQASGSRSVELLQIKNADSRDKLEVQAEITERAYYTS